MLGKIYISQCCITQNLKYGKMENQLVPTPVTRPLFWSKTEHRRHTPFLFTGMLRKFYLCLNSRCRELQRYTVNHPDDLVISLKSVYVSFLLVTISSIIFEIYTFQFILLFVSDRIFLLNPTVILGLPHFFVSILELIYIFSRLSESSNKMWRGVRR